MKLMNLINQDTRDIDVLEIYVHLQNKVKVFY